MAPNERAGSRFAWVPRVARRIRDALATHSDHSEASLAYSRTLERTRTRDGATQFVSADSTRASADGTFYSLDASRVGTVLPPELTRARPAAVSAAPAPAPAAHGSDSESELEIVEEVRRGDDGTPFASFASFASAASAPRESTFYASADSTRLAEAPSRVDATHGTLFLDAPSRVHESTFHSLADTTMEPSSDTETGGTQHETIELGSSSEAEDASEAENEAATPDGASEADEADEADDVDEIDEIDEVDEVDEDDEDAASVIEEASGASDTNGASMASDGSSAAENMAAYASAAMASNRAGFEVDSEEPDMSDEDADALAADEVDAEEALDMEVDDVDGEFDADALDADEHGAGAADGLPEHEPIDVELVSEYDSDTRAELSDHEVREYNPELSSQSLFQSGGFVPYDEPDELAYDGHDGHDAAGYAETEHDLQFPLNSSQEGLNSSQDACEYVHSGGESDEGARAKDNFSPQPGNRAARSLSYAESTEPGSELDGSARDDDGLQALAAVAQVFAFDAVAEGVSATAPTASAEDPASSSNMLAVAAAETAAETAAEAATKAVTDAAADAAAAEAAEEALADHVAATHEAAEADPEAQKEAVAETAGLPPKFMRACGFMFAPDSTPVHAATTSDPAAEPSPVQPDLAARAPAAPDSLEDAEPVDSAAVPPAPVDLQPLAPVADASVDYTGLSALFDTGFAIKLDYSGPSQEAVASDGEDEHDALAMQTHALLSNSALFGGVPRKRRWDGDVPPADTKFEDESRRVAASARRLLAASQLFGGKPRRAPRAKKARFTNVEQ